MKRTTLLLSSVLLLAAKSKPKATPVPSSTDASVSSGERKLGAGTASFKLGTKEIQLDKVAGSIQTSSGFQIASVAFTDGDKRRLQLDFMFLVPGPVEQGYITNIYAVEDGATSAFKKGVGSCTLTLAKATPTMVEGTASCPKGMLDLANKPAKPITDVKFHAEANEETK
jgi:hypothetical protein